MVKFYIFVGRPDNLENARLSAHCPTSFFSANRPLKMPEMGISARIWSPCSSVSSASSSSSSSAAAAATQKQILKLRSTTEQLDSSTVAADHHHRWILSPPQQLSNEEKLMEEFLNCVENSNQHFDFAENKMLSTPTTLSLGTI